MLPDDTSGRTLALLFLNIAATREQWREKHKAFEFNCLKRKAFDFFRCAKGNFSLTPKKAFDFNYFNSSNYFNS